MVYTGQGIPERKLPFEILRNDTTIQAIMSEDKNMMQAIFYPRGEELQWGNNSMKVSSPCVVMLKNKDAYMQLFVADATMNSSIKQIVVEFNGKEILVDLPQGSHLGNWTSVKVLYDNPGIK